MGCGNFCDIGSSHELLSWGSTSYLRYGLSLHDVEELLAERGIEADHVTIHRTATQFCGGSKTTTRLARDVAS